DLDDARAVEVGVVRRERMDDVLDDGRIDVALPGGHAPRSDAAPAHVEAPRRERFETRGEAAESGPERRSAPVGVRGALAAP
ncbi:MAG TPA: hypothetical protein VIL20_18905, partial [Sandaracinaceae bacterium]